MKNKFFSIIGLNTLGYFQILGGIIGFYSVINILLKTGEINGPTLVVFLIVIGLLLLSIKAGKELLQFKKKKSILLSIINNILQIFQLKLFSYGFIYSSGGEIVIGFWDGVFDISFALLKSNFNIAIDRGNDSTIGINLLAIVILIYLFKAKEKIQMD